MTRNLLIASLTLLLVGAGAHATEPNKCDLLIQAVTTPAATGIISKMKERHEAKTELPDIPKALQGSFEKERQQAQQAREQAEQAAVRERKAKPLRDYRAGLRAFVSESLRAKFEEATRGMSESDIDKLIDIAGPDGQFFRRPYRYLGLFPLEVGVEMNGSKTSLYNKEINPTTIAFEKPAREVEALVVEAGKNLAEMFIEMGTSEIDDGGHPVTGFRWKLGQVKKSPAQMSFLKWSREKYAALQANAKFAKSHRAAFEVVCAVVANAMFELGSKERKEIFAVDGKGVPEATVFETKIKPALVRAYEYMGWEEIVAPESAPAPQTAGPKSLSQIRHALSVEALEKLNPILKELHAFAFGKLFPKVPSHNSKLADVNSEWFNKMHEYLQLAAKKVKTGLASGQDRKAIEKAIAFEQEHRIPEVRAALDDFEAKTYELGRMLGAIDDYIDIRVKPLQDQLDQLGPDFAVKGLNETHAKLTSAIGNWMFFKKDVELHIGYLAVGVKTSHTLARELDVISYSIDRLLTMMNSRRAVGLLLEHITRGGVQVQVLTRPEANDLQAVTQPEADDSQKLEDFFDLKPLDTPVKVPVDPNSPY